MLIFSFVEAVKAFSSSAFAEIDCDLVFGRLLFIEDQMLDSGEASLAAASQGHSDSQQSDNSQRSWERNPSKFQLRACSSRLIGAWKCGVRPSGAGAAVECRGKQEGDCF